MYCLFLLFEAAVVSIFDYVVVPLTSMYTTLSHKLDINIVVLNLIWQLVLFVLRLLNCII